MSGTEPPVMRLDRSLAKLRSVFLQDDPSVPLDPDGKKHNHPEARVKNTRAAGNSSSRLLLWPFARLFRNWGWLE
jgi:hypothetical protein